jgi:hypothetical protein
MHWVCLSVGQRAASPVWGFCAFLTPCTGEPEAAEVSGSGFSQVPSFGVRESESLLCPSSPLHLLRQSLLLLGRSGNKVALNPE